MIKELTFIVTFYCSCTICTPGKNITKDGSRPLKGFTVACDREHLGKYVYLKLNTGNNELDLGVFKCEDTGSAIKHNRIDIYVNDHNVALKYGKRKVKGWWIP